MTRDSAMQCGVGRPDSLGNSCLASQSTAATSTRNRWQDFNTSRSPTSSFGPLASPYENSTGPSTQRTSWSKGPFLGLSREPSVDEPTATLPVAGPHRHWCFVCDKQREYSTCDGWKRHMKEHETSYPCMPRGCETDTANGPACVLCGITNPDEIHFSSHKIRSCLHKDLVARSYTRKAHLVSHLKTHGISGSSTSTLAEEWRATLDKKHFSCGFCVACFHSHTDQLNHIHDTHYKNHQHIDEWDSNRIIQGLLLQPGVQESWRKLMLAHPQYSDSGFRWSFAAINNLQFRLEKSEETANDLALAAFNISTYDWMQCAQDESKPVASCFDQGVSFSDNKMMIPPRTTSLQIPLTPSMNSVYHGAMMNSALEAQYDAWYSIATNHLSPGVLKANTKAYQNNSSQESTTGNLPQSSESPSSSIHGWAPPQSFSFNRWSSTPSDAHGGQMSNLSRLAAVENLQASSSAEPSTSHGEHQNGNNAGRTRNNVATKPTFLNFGHPASLSTQATSFPHPNGPFSLSTRPTKQPSYPKLKYHYGTDIEANVDIDLDCYTF